MARIAIFGRVILANLHGVRQLILNVDARENAILIRVYDAFKFVLKLVALVDKLNLDDEGERAAFLPLRLADDVATKLPDQLAANVQAKSDSTRVDFFRLLEEPIHLEKLRHIVLYDSDASVRNGDLQEII